MSAWEFVCLMTGGYIAIVILFKVIDRWIEGRNRDKRVAEWTQMVKDQRRERSDGMDHWATRTWRERDKKE